jgi:pimeloyl-ACP methyl ester carboxylesterase
LFLHGFPMDHRMWDRVVPHLAGLRRCVAVDLPGFGDSPLVHPLTIDIMADLAAGVVGNEPVDVVGLSMGGYVAFSFWVHHSELVRSIALLDTRSEADPPEGKVRRHETADRVRSEGVAFLADELAESLPAPTASPWVRRQIRRMALDSPAPTVAATLEAMAARHDRTAMLAQITVPVMVMVGEEDRLTPPEGARAMAERIPTGVLVEVPEAGHVPPLERPDAVVDALRRFWSE